MAENKLNLKKARHTVKSDKKEQASPDNMDDWDKAAKKAPLTFNDKKDSSNAVSPPPPLLPPNAESQWVRWLHEVMQHLGLFFLVILAILVCMGMIYLDYQQTTRRRIAMVQHHQCIHALKSSFVDQFLLTDMGIANPPPDDLDAMEQNVRQCQTWRAELEHNRPFGGWYRELLVAHLKKQANSQFNADTHATKP